MNQPVSKVDSHDSLIMDFNLHALIKTLEIFSNYQEVDETAIKSN